MGNRHVKPEGKLKYIDGEVSGFRESIRQQEKGTSKATQEAQYQYLVKLSEKVSSLEGRVREKNLNRTQENISRTLTEVFSKPVQERESNLDSGAVETDSSVGVPMNKRHSSTRRINEIPTKKPKSSQVTMSKHVSTLQDIDMKFKSLKPQIKTAIDNKESTQLRFHKKTIEVLATDLKMIEIYDDTPIGDRKEKLVSALTSQYQKINSAMKEIQRNKGVDYLVNQQNNTLMRNLEEIRKELGKTDATLKEAVKNDSINLINTAKENLVKINQKLSSIEVNDGNAKQMKMQMLDQITWLFKYINESTTKGSQSDLTKAQVNYEDRMKGIARGTNKNKDDIQIKLESLQTFINTIEEKEECDARKKQLLHNINDSFSSLCEIGKKEPDVVNGDQERTAPRTAVDVLNEVNQFCKSMEESMRQMKFSDSEFNELVRSLENLIHSIKSTRRNISADIPKLSKKQNHSVPDLTKFHCIRDEFKSNSNPNTPEGMRKTGNYFDPYIPRVESINDGSPELRNGMSSKRNDNCFSAVDQIRTQVNYIKERINDIEDKSIVMNKLTTFRKILLSYFNHSNQTIANNARLVSADIQDLSKNLRYSETDPDIFPWKNKNYT
ncbi:hypothetical protein JTB14_002654 [Gonioctena quinquepunctata]|nr:hypothetical protein JTB14_002654 [Gonioctena quinquepunctata]